MTMKSYALLGTSMGALLALQVQPVQAQSTETGIGEIVVTAQKREQRLQDVGLSVAAVGAQQLETQRITTLQDIARVVPGLVYSQSQLSTPVYTLRGVGFNEATFAGYPDVSVYIDQVPLPLPVLTSNAAYDLERIEVLKGPQGTLFGNNATGGAVNLIAAKPQDVFGAGGTFSYGRFNTVEFSGYVTGPILDTLKARLAVRVEKGDDWQRSYTSNATNGERNNVAARFLADWEATDRLTISINVNGSKDRGEPQAPQFILLNEQNPAGKVGLFGTVPADAPVLNYPVYAGSDPRAADFSTGDRADIVTANPDLEPVRQFSPYQDNYVLQGALRIDYDVLDSVTFTSLTSYIDSRVRSFVDTDGTRLYAQDFGQFGKIRSFSQEARVAGRGRLQWVLGANYENTKVNEFQTNYSYDTTSRYVNGAGLTLQGSDQKMKNYAVFGNLEFKLTPALTLRGGVRRTWADRDFVGSNRQATYQDPDPAGFGFSTFFNVLGNYFKSLGLFPNYQDVPLGACFMFDNRTNADGSPVDPSTYGTAGCYNDKLRERSTSWSVGGDFKVTDDVLLYATVAKGYKAGSFPLAGAAGWSQLGAVRQESLIDYEVGFKAQFADRKITLNGSVFYYDYRDKQLRSFIVDPVFGLLFSLVNVPKSKIKGAEFDLSVRPIEGLTITASGTYLDATIRQFNGIVGAAVDENGLNVPVFASYAGSPLPFAPKFQGAASVQYEGPISDSLNFVVGANVSGQTKSYAAPYATAFDRENLLLKDRVLVGGNIGIQAPNGRWSATLWGKNIFNKYYRTTTLQNYDGIVAYAGRPAEYGIALGFKM